MNDRSPMRLLIADHDSLRGGGQLGLTRYLQSSSGFERSILTMADGVVAATARSQGLQTLVVPAPRGRVKFLRTLFALRRAVQGVQPDIVLTNSLRMANLLSLSLKKGRLAPRYIAYLREDLSKDNLGQIKRWYMGAVTIQRCDGLLANSMWTESTIPPFARKPTRIAYPVSGVSAQPARALSPSEEPLRVLSLSRLTEWKGIHILIEACRLLESAGLANYFTVTIAGEGDMDDPYVKQLRIAAKASGVSIFFVGHVEDVDQLLRTHDTLAHCSTRPEAYGQVIPQALSHGLAIIATNAGGPAEMIEHGSSGLLIRPGDAAELASALRLLIEDRLKAEALATRGQELSIQYEDVRTLADFEDAIRELVTQEA